MSKEHTEGRKQYFSTETAEGRVLEYGPDQRLCMQEDKDNATIYLDVTLPDSSGDCVW